MNIIGVLIIAYLFIRVGMSLEPGLQTTLATITTPTYSSGVVGINEAILPAMFISSLIVLLLFLRRHAG